LCSFVAQEKEQVICAFNISPDFSRNQVNIYFKNNYHLIIRELMRKIRLIRRQKMLNADAFR